MLISTLKVLSWNLDTLCNSFYLILPIVGFFSSSHNQFHKLIVTSKHGIYKLPHELPKDLILRISEN